MTSTARIVGDVADRLDGRLLAVAESVTAGQVAQLFAEQQGSSEWFCGGLVAWQHHVKYDLLGVPEGDPVVTADAALAMARGAASLLDADVALATTGAGGPTGQDGAPPGRAYVATWVDGATAVRELQVTGPPPTVCANAVRAALELLAEQLLEHPAKGS